MSAVIEERWELLERVGAYAAGELTGEEARETERLLTENDDYRRLAEAYTRMFVFLSVAGQESPDAPESVLNHALRRAYMSAFLRQAEHFLGNLGGSYLGAIAHYLKLSMPREQTT